MLARLPQGSESGRGVATDNNRQREPDVRHPTDRGAQQQMAAYGPLCAMRSKPQNVITCVFPDKLGTTGYFSGITFMGITV